MKVKISITKNAYVCTGCNGREPIHPPKTITELQDGLEAFRKKHEKCMEVSKS